MSDNEDFRYQNAFHQYAWQRLERYAEGWLVTFAAHTHISMDPEMLGITRKGKDKVEWKYARWKRTFDMKRIGEADDTLRKFMLITHEPSILTSEGILPVERFKDTIKASRELTLPPLSADDSLGLDGSSFSLRFGDGFRNTTYHWWEQLPFDWQTLKPVMEEVKAAIRIGREKAGLHSSTQDQV
jgi:hypothetical protein